MNLVELAIRIKGLRKARELTLEELAGRTGLTGSMLSKIENFRVTPSLPGLSRIAEGLGVTLSELFEGLDERPKLTVVKADHRRRLSRDDSPWIYWSLAAGPSGRVMDPFMIEIPPGEQRREAAAHEGEEFMLVLEGPVDYVYGCETHQLETGDSVYDVGNEVHTLVNRSDHTVRLMVVYCNPK